MTPLGLVVYKSKELAHTLQREVAATPGQGLKVCSPNHTAVTQNQVFGLRVLLLCRLERLGSPGEPQGKSISQTEAVLLHMSRGIQA